MQDYYPVVILFNVGNWHHKCFEPLSEPCLVCSDSWRHEFIILHLYLDSIFIISFWLYQGFLHCTFDDDGLYHYCYDFVMKLAFCLYHYKHFYWLAAILNDFSCSIIILAIDHSCFANVSVSGPWVGLSSYLDFESFSSYYIVFNSKSWSMI